MSVFVELLFDAERKLEWLVKVHHQGWHLMSILETEPPLSKAAFNWKGRHLELASDVVSTRRTGSWKPAALFHHKTNHPAADAVVIIQAHSCPQYLWLQPEMQSKDGRMLGGNKESWFKQNTKKNQQLEEWKEGYIITLKKEGKKKHRKG